VQNLVQLRLAFLYLPLFVVEPAANGITDFLGTKLGVGHGERVVVRCYFVSQLTVNIDEFSHLERGSRLVLNCFLAKLVDVDQ
jgi:hypothetical protein